jgi:pseudouridine synthase
VIELLKGVREYVYPVGRLDYDSEGLLLLTSDGDLAARLTHPRHAVERVYEAVVVGVPADDDLEKLRRGIFLDGSRTAPAQVKRAGTVGKGRNELSRLLLTLREGRNRQVRRMCASIGHPVRKLTRTRMGPIKLGDLRPGHWRDLTAREIRLLQEAASLLPPDAPAK